VLLGEYSSEAFFQQEQATVFRKYPVILGHLSELAEPGSYMQHDALGLPIVLTRDLEGDLHAFLNVCRHRGTRLVHADGPCKGKTLVCPYHGWTYELDGRLRHIPLLEEGFPGIDCAKQSLVELPSAVRAGLIWVLPTAEADMDIDAYLGPMAAELEYLIPPGFTLFKRFESTRKANWKLVVDAFLEAYHVRVLHRNTVYPFFKDAWAVSEVYGPHYSSLVGRRRLDEAFDLPPVQWDLREFGSYTQFVFPNSVFVHHPDYSSVLTLFPQGVDSVRWVHLMLIPEEQNTVARQAHWQETLNLIEKGVFQAEDLFVAESAQSAIHSGANDTMTLGRLEYLIQNFHDELHAAIDRG
jgi:phenylpropionate dioxygenase-like ring-hydroxylating dioxygenase large terminal subunit